MTRQIDDQDVKDEAREILLIVDIILEIVVYKIENSWEIELEPDSLSITVARERAGQLLLDNAIGVLSKIAAQDPDREMP